MKMLQHEITPSYTVIVFLTMNPIIAIDMQYTNVSIKIIYNQNLHQT